MRPKRIICSREVHVSSYLEMIHFGVIKGLKSINSFKPNSLTILFRLHYQYACALFIGFCLIISSKQLSDSIDCFDSSKMPRDIIDNYCLLHGTFTIESNKTLRRNGNEISHVGVERYSGKQQVINHTYYQWTGIFMLIQAFFMYIPYIYLINSGSKHKDNQVEDNEGKDDVKRTLFFAEMMNLVSVGIQILLLDKFLNKQFFNYGFRYLHYLNEDNAVFPNVFPKMTKCTINFYGASGDVAKMDTVCLLLYNNVNEKFYLAIWFICYSLFVADLIRILYLIAKFAYLKHPCNRITNFYEKVTMKC